MRCAVITPIGPGHDQRYAVARASIDHAAQQSRGPFDEIVHLPLPDPFGQFGRSRRRNDGIRTALEQGIDWLFFLDADDFMAPQAFAAVAPHVGRLDAVWGQICEMSPGETTPRLREGQIKATADIADILINDPYLTLQMGHFVRTEAAAAVMFDAEMDTGEDFKYYLGLWSRVRCAKVEEIFFVNLRGYHSVGPRSADGGQWRAAVQQVICDAAAGRDLTAQVTLEGVATRFAITNPFDIVQMHLCRGMFFDQEALLHLRGQIGSGKSILDVGAGIGNHTLFYARHMAARRVHPFEPDPAKAALLGRNIALNGLDGIVDRRGCGAPLTALDHAMAGVAVDFIRLDAPGMALAVMEGARDLIAANRPMMSVTLADGGAPPFDDWLRRNGYQLVGAAQSGQALAVLVGPRR